MPVILLEESGLSSSSVAGRDSAAQGEAARAAGFEVEAFSGDLLVFGGVDEAFASIAPRSRADDAVWLGFVPTIERYREVFEAAARLGLRLPNTPEQHLEVMEFQRFYPRLEGLTPRSVVLRDLEGCAAAIEALGLPVFVKGALQSLKARGPSACVASTEEELRSLVGALLGHHLARGHVIVRELVPLRFSRRSPSGMPMGREFRVFLHDGRVISTGFYWQGDDELAALSGGERARVEALAREAAARLSARHVAVDVGQLDDGSWTLIEVGDAQFAGMGQAPPEAHFRALLAAMRGAP